MLLIVLIVLALSTPSLLAVLVLFDVPVFVGLLFALPLAAAQIATVALMAHRRLLDRLAPPAADAVSLTRDLADAESAARQAEDMMHTLRSSVTGITASYRLLRDRHDEMGQSTRLRLEKMHEEELFRLERLVHPGHPGRPALQAVDLHRAITALVDSWRLQGNRVAWSGTELSARGRQDDVTEIVQALLENVAAHAPGAPAVVSVGREGDLVAVRVSDFGRGVPPSVAVNVFDRGVRDPHSSGEGLGLHIARSMARDMGGDLRLDAGGAAHASFVLTLPAVEE